MTKYILDTDIISYLWDEKSPYHKNIVSHLEKLKNDDVVGMSIVSYYELRYGTEVMGKELKSSFEIALDVIKNDPNFEIFSLNFVSADFFSQLKTTYKDKIGINAKSNKKNDLDFIIASLAMSENAILVSNDSIFETLSKSDKRLKYENWTK